MTDLARERIEQELKKFPTPVLEEYLLQSPRMAELLSDDEMTIWAAEGVALARQTVRSWEAAVEYYRASPDVAKLLSFSSFMQWARSGGTLCADAPALASAYFRASPPVVAHIRPQYITKWSGLGQSLYKGTWKSSSLASRFFEVSPALVKYLPFWEMEVFVSLVEALSYKSYDIALEALTIGQELLGRMGREREAFLSLSRALVDLNWRELKHCLEATPRALALVDDDQRPRFLRLTERLARSGLSDIGGFLVEGSQALHRATGASQRYVLDLCEMLVAMAPEAMPAFLRSLPTVLGRVSATQLDSWFQHGMRLMQENTEGGLAYFKLESSTAEQVLETLSSSVELERIKELMRMYCRALAGAQVEILATKDLVDKHIGWVNEGVAATEGTRVYLPPVVDRYPEKDHNFTWFKVVSTHQVAHLEFGSFDFLFERPSTLFKDLRPQWEARLHPRGNGAASNGHHAGDNAHTTPAVVPDPASAERGWVTDMGRFFNLFKDRRLALDIFTAVEDGRLDYRVKQEYRGIAAPYQSVQVEALQDRPHIEELPLRQAMVEMLVRLSLQQEQGLPAPRDYLKEARLIVKIARRTLRASATVEDAAEAAIRIYAIISRLPNKQVPQEQWQPEDFNDQDDYSEQELQDYLGQQGPQDDPAGESGGEEGGEEQPYESPSDVDFRGEFKPETVQLLSMLRRSQQKGQGEAQQLSRQQLEQALKDSPEMDLDPESARLEQELGARAENLLKEAGVPPQPTTRDGQGYAPLLHDEDQGGSLEPREPRTYAYDEWDFRAADYKPKWCIVREKNMDEGDAGFFAETLRNYASLMADIRRQFELVVPEAFRKIKRLQDGEDLDMDALIEAQVDRRSGVTPSEKLYWRRNKVERDVAVAFLLDMSASTAEAIDEGHHGFNDQDAPDDPVEYMIWLRNRREGASRRHYKRIIDIEKESVVLLIQAIETIGDLYGIYGFSGYGRENVEFYVVKDIEEGFSDRVKRRIDKITPLHATRMGPAIRHATAKLQRQDARTKLLFLISDGRPQDRGYSREGVEKEYAVHDTRMALIEARRHNIIPFCLTVDKAGHDYLKTMVGDMGYEVVNDIWNLPQRLPQLYRKLTI